MATSLLFVGVGAAVAQDTPSDPLAGGQRVEIPEAGVALTVPAGWEVNLPMQPGPGDVLQALLAYEVGSGYCGLSLHRLDDPTLLDDPAVFHQYVDTSMWAYRTDPDIEASDAMTAVTLHAGPALRVDMVERLAEGDLHFSVYAVDTADGIAFLDCGGYVRPGDDWSSIADTLELVPTEE